jgi:hypothetical protein
MSGTNWLCKTSITTCNTGRPKTGRHQPEIRSGHYIRGYKTESGALQRSPETKEHRSSAKARFSIVTLRRRDMRRPRQRRKIKNTSNFTETGLKTLTLIMTVITAVVRFQIRSKFLTTTWID